MRFVAGRGAAAEHERWHRARVLLRSKDAVNAQAPMRSQLAGWPGCCCRARALPHVCGTEQAPWQSKGADNAKAPMRNQLAGWPGCRCRARALPRVCGTERRCCGARAPTIRRHRRGARAANKAQAPLRGSGAGTKQELARGVRS